MFFNDPKFLLTNKLIHMISLLFGLCTENDYRALKKRFINKLYFLKGIVDIYFFHQEYGLRLP